MRLRRVTFRPFRAPACYDTPSEASAVVQSAAMASWASGNSTAPSHTSWCSFDSTASFAFGEAPGSTQRFRGSFGSPPSSSGTRWYPAVKSDAADNAHVTNFRQIERVVANYQAFAVDDAHVAHALAGRAALSVVALTVLAGRRFLSWRSGNERCSVTMSPM
jgi:hypothetical protein